MQLGELADQIIVGRAPRGPDSAIDIDAPVLNLRDVGRVLPPITELDRVGVVASDIDRSGLAPGDVIITARGANVRAAVAGEDYQGVMLGANLIAIRVRKIVPPYLLAAFLRHPMTVATLMADFAGATTAGFTVESLKRLVLEPRSSQQNATLDAFVRQVDVYAMEQAEALRLYQEAAEEAAFQHLLPYGPRSPR
jgi:hypothetical protein